MLSRKMKYGLILLLSLLMVNSFLSQTVSAAAYSETLSSGVKVTDTAGSTTKNSDTKVTATIKCDWYSGKANTITLTNTKEKNATLTFTYTFTAGGDGTMSKSSTGTLSDINGACSVTLAAGGTVTFEINAEPIWFESTTSTLVIDAITLVEVADSAAITFSYDSSLGNVTADGASVANGKTVEATAKGVTIAATSADGCQFLGWIDGQNKILSSSSSYTLQATGDCTVRALFVRANESNAWFTVGDGYLYDDLNVAVEKGTKVVPVFSGVLPAGDYTIPTGVTLLIPNDSANTVYTKEPGSEKDYLTAPSVYRTLTMAKGANITVNGAISVAGMQGSVQNGHNGAPRGPLGYIDMASGSKITVDSGGNLYAWGYIKGSGAVEIKSGGTVYEDFQVMDWRGGSATLDMNNNTERVFPLSQYYVQNIEVPMTLQAGATEMVSTAMTISMVGLQRASVEFIGDEGMFRLTSGSFTKDYDEATDRLILDLNGDISLSKFELTMKLSVIGTKTFDSSKYTLPINNNITINVNTGSTATVAQDIAVLPGVKIVIAEDATVTLGKGNKIFVYDTSEWKASYIYNASKAYRPLTYIAAPAGSSTYGTPKDRAADMTKDGEILINGLANASSGSVYTTAGGGNIHSNGSGQLIIGTSSDMPTHYQATQSGSDITYEPISITPAILQNGDTRKTATVETAGVPAGTTFYYHPEHQRWIPVPHDAGTDKQICACGLTNYSFRYSNQIGWDGAKTMWYLKSNLYVQLGGKILDHAALSALDYGVFFMTETEWTNYKNANADANSLTKPSIAIMREAGKEYTKDGTSTSASVADGDKGAMVTAELQEYFLTSELGDENIYVLFYIEDADSHNNSLRCYGQVKLRNLKALAEQAIEDGVYQNTAEYEIYVAMTNTVAAVEENQSTFTSIPAMPSYMSAAPSVGYFGPTSNAGLAVKHSASVVLIEPWGLRLNGYISGSFDDYGLVILNDRDREYRYEMPSPQQLMANPDAQVYSVSDGSAAVNFGVDIGTGSFTQITTDYIGDLRTYELGNNIYVAFFVKDGGNYRFGEVQKYNVYLLCRQALAMDLPESEKAVYLAMIDMFHKVSDYRK